MEYHGMKYFARHNKYTDGHEMFIPDFPECCSAAESVEETLRDVKRNLSWSIVERLRKKQSVPLPSDRTAALQQAVEMQQQIEVDTPECDVLSWDMLEVEVDLSPW
jgi:predicted RNase H-like HicB family nuclease